MLDIRECLKPAIERSGMKQVAIASRINLTEQQLSDIINKRRRLDANELINICTAIHITPNEMLMLALQDIKPPEDLTAPVKTA